MKTQRFVKWIVFVFFLFGLNQNMIQAGSGSILELSINQYMVFISVQCPGSTGFTWRVAVDTQSNVVYESSTATGSFQIDASKINGSGTHTLIGILRCQNETWEQSTIRNISFNWSTGGGSPISPAFSGNIPAENLSTEEASARCRQAFGASSFSVRTSSNVWECSTNGTYVPIPGVVPSQSNGQSNGDQPNSGGGVPSSGSTVNMSVEQVAAICRSLYGFQSAPIRTSVWECTHDNTSSPIGEYQNSTESQSGPSVVVPQQSSPTDQSNSPSVSRGSGAACMAPEPVYVGGTARVTPGVANRLRADHSVTSEQIGSIQPGEEFTILAGSVCQDGFRWWQVNYNGQVGWTVDGGDTEYWIERVTSSSPDIQSQPNITETIKSTGYLRDISAVSTAPNVNYGMSVIYVPNGNSYLVNSAHIDFELKTGPIAIGCWVLVYLDLINSDGGNVFSQSFSFSYFSQPVQQERVEISPGIEIQEGFTLLGKIIRNCAATTRSALEGAVTSAQRESTMGSLSDGFGTTINVELSVP